jgi:hypothetical protein
MPNDLLAAAAIGSGKLPAGLALAVVPLLVLIIALDVYCLIDLARAKSVRNVPRWVWAIVILFVSAPIGALVYLFAGRDRGQDAAHDPAPAPAVAGADGGEAGASTEAGAGGRRGECVGDLDADVADLCRAYRPAPAQRVVQRARRAEFHHQVRPAVIEGPGIVDVDHVRVPGQPARRGHLAHEPPPVAVAEQHPVVHLHGHFPADRYLPGPVDGRVASPAENAPDLMPGNVRCCDREAPA